MRRWEQEMPREVPRASTSTSNDLRIVGDEDDALLFLVVEDMEHLFQHEHLPCVAQGRLISPGRCRHGSLRAPSRAHAHALAHAHARAHMCHRNDATWGCKQLRGQSGGTPLESAECTLPVPRHLVQLNFLLPVDTLTTLPCTRRANATRRQERDGRKRAPAGRERAGKKPACWARIAS